MCRNIILNVPHSSIEGVFDRENGWHKSLPYLQREVKKWTDWYTDMLFVNGDSRVKMVKSGFSRFVVDVERLVDDPMEKDGQGIIYSHFNGIKRDLMESRKDELMGYYYAYRKRLSDEIKSENDILIDCHSFPSELAPDVSICIGYNDDWSKPSQSFLERIAHIFEKHCLSVSFNKPYSNSITPESKYEYKSFMIEVNKNCYMDEKTLELNYYNRFSGAILEVYDAILD